MKSHHSRQAKLWLIFALFLCVVFWITKPNGKRGTNIETAFYNSEAFKGDISKWKNNIDIVIPSSRGSHVSELNTSDESKLPMGTCEFSKFPDNIIVPDLDMPDIHYNGSEDCVQECQCAYPKSLSLKKIKSNCRSHLSIPEQHSIPGLEVFDEIKCPWDDSANRYHDEKRYAERADQCSRAKGMWGGSYTRSYHCMMQWAGRGQYIVGQRILDWGSGCGHTGSWLRQLYGAYVYGIDVEPSPVKWAQQHSMGSFCATDGTKLDFLKDDYFDHVYTAGAIHHLPMDIQCSVVKEFIRVTKVGGTIAMLFLGNHLKDRPSPAYSFWENCISKSNYVDIEFAQCKKDIIGNWGIGPMDENAFGRYLPNYSIRISIKGKPLGSKKYLEKNLETPSRSVE